MSRSQTFELIVWLIIVSSFTYAFIQVLKFLENPTVVVGVFIICSYLLWICLLGYWLYWIIFKGGLK